MTTPELHPIELAPTAGPTAGPTATPAPQVLEPPPATSLAPQEPRPLTEAEQDAQQAEEWARLDAEEWASGENRATRVGRAAFALVAGGYLLWTQNQTTAISPNTNWNSWIALAVLCNAVLPLVIANLFFAQSILRHTPGDYWRHWRHGVPLASFHDYLPDQRLVSWRLGWKWSPLRRLLGLGVLMWALMLPALWLASRDDTARHFYRFEYFPPVSDARSWLWLLGTLILYMACWEWFFRGFLLFTLAQGFGAAAAIAVQAIVFGLAHVGKPPMEVASSFAGGLVLGVVCWREKSFVPALVTHALIHLSWAILILKF